VFNLEFEVEHIVPAARSGSDELSNLALACRSCNLRKGTSERARDPLTGDLTRLFDPRRDDWGQHFWLSLDSFYIQGLTDVGRATARRLGMNRPLPVHARRLWVSRLLLRF
jgi:hypothetical protein